MPAGAPVTPGQLGASFSLFLNPHRTPHFVFRPRAPSHWSYTQFLDHRTSFCKGEGDRTEEDLEEELQEVSVVLLLGKTH